MVPMSVWHQEGVFDEQVQKRFDPPGVIKERSMPTRDTFPYRFETYEPALYVELYLPKITKYQGTLYDGLTKGFEVNYVANYLKTHKQHIQQLLEYDSLKAYDDTRIDRMKPIKWGYSMYEVDGVFWSESEQKISEGRTQVIRIIFRFSKEHMMQECQITERTYISMRSLLRKLLEMEAVERKTMENDASGETLFIIRYIDEWVDDVALFLFGYLVFQIGLNIHEKVEKKELARFEEEIWITSFGNLQINRVLLREGYQAR